MNTKDDETHTNKDPRGEFLTKYDEYLSGTRSYSDLPALPGVMLQETTPKEVESDLQELKHLETKVETIVQEGFAESIMMIMAFIEGLLETVCSQAGDHLRVANKIKLYKKVLQLYADSLDR